MLEFASIMLFIIVWFCIGHVSYSYSKKSSKRNHIMGPPYIVYLLGGLYSLAAVIINKDISKK